MKKKVMKQWTKLLRSGKFKQGSGNLLHRGKHCCLGVLCELALVEGVCDFEYNQTYNSNRYDQQSGTLPLSVREWSGMKSDIGYLKTLGGEFPSLAALNDEGGRTFRQLANIIEKNYKKL